MVVLEIGSWVLPRFFAAGVHQFCLANLKCSYYALSICPKFETYDSPTMLYSMSIIKVHSHSDVNFKLSKDRNLYQNKSYNIV